MKAQKSRLVLMITDQNGSRYFNVSSIFKQVALYAIVFVITLMAFGVISIKTFSAEIKKMAILNENIAKRYKKMLAKNEALNIKIEQRMEEITEVDNRVGDLESIIGVSTEVPEGEQNNLEHRIDAASLSGTQKAFVMKFVPNGYPMEHYNRISADYGYRVHPLFFTRHLHTGVDFATSIGTPVYATADGVVNAASFSTGGYGYLVKIDHSLGFMTYYAHLNKIVVQKGMFVKRGQLIAYSGNTGQSTGPHLHYEIRFLGNVIDPKNFMEWKMSNFDSIFEKERSVAWQSLLATINSLME
ncbi:toxR-activated protein [Helicobacter cinaedi PAGU611]|uniref:Peptidase, M23 family n=2 Tax=Helicobacter cinaedi CCUG 18818 = ATCC BAA-847 TaxID=537971 RepID=A0ABN0BDK2_9HELI|nr:M23 family metallopeptidase [Helicobacter cinaedi]AWK61457.1 M23 family peptidase [Helicobacter cinaedi]EFR47551.1 peptidase, M23 family [Helicobacter cinaedi CCUG 18818 = ATCC BAA-847]QOQ91374.1 M23 family metallopeptidase [Helicobacter cinaedi]QOQ95562.1 M23 family metallopeptidase [Helicobacter cinaedi]BAM12514.1 toxR-activated protein [Helicobacter cinaedi PAGU611]